MGSRVLPPPPSDPTSYAGSVGIPSEGVVVYEFAPEDDNRGRGRHPTPTAPGRRCNFEHRRR